MLTTILKSLWSRKRRLLGTCIAVVLGVAFLAGTMILGDTTKSGFSSTFASANDGTDVVVRNGTRIGSEEDRTRGLIDESTVAEVASVSGVATAVPEVRGVAQIIGADGKPVGGNGPPTIATNWIEDPELSWLTLTEGRAPASTACAPRCCGAHARPCEPFRRRAHRSATEQLPRHDRLLCNEASPSSPREE